MEQWSTPSFIRLGLASYSPGIISTRRREHFHQSIHHRFRHNVPTQPRQQPYSESESCIGGIALWSDGIKENPRAATELLNIGFFVSHQAQHSSPLVSAQSNTFQTQPCRIFERSCYIATEHVFMCAGPAVNGSRTCSAADCTKIQGVQTKKTFVSSPAANSMYIRMCICMCLSYSPNKGGTTEVVFLLTL